MPAHDAFQTGQHLFGLHAAHQAADAFQIAIASAPETDILHPAVLNLQFYVAATRALRLIQYLHRRMRRFILRLPASC